MSVSVCYLIYAVVLTLPRDIADYTEQIKHRQEHLTLRRMAEGAKDSSFIAKAFCNIGKLLRLFEASPSSSSDTAEIDSSPQLNIALNINTTVRRMNQVMTLPLLLLFDRVTEIFYYSIEPGEAIYFW